METKLYLRFLKVSLLLFLSLCMYGQDWQKINSIELKQTPTSYSADFQGNLYLGFADGRLTKYNSKGKFLENFSLSNNSSISLIDVQNNLRPFLFYFDNQQITILDRFSSVPKNYPLSNFRIQIGMMACPAPDGDFWVAENNPQRLKKINPLLKITVLEVQVSIGDSIKSMMAYQNILVVGDEKGLHIFDQFGGLIQTLEIGYLISFQIVAGKLYAFSTNYIYEIDPFSGRVLSVLEKPIPSGTMIKSKDGFLSIANKILTFYKVNK